MRKFIAGAVLGAVLMFPIAGHAYSFSTQSNVELTGRLNALCKATQPEDGTRLTTWLRACPNVAGPHLP